MNINNTGLVIRNTGSCYEVELEDNSSVFCRIKGSFRIKGIRTTNPISVGDRVDFVIGENAQEGLITNIHPRRNYIIRKSINLSKEAHILATNLDNVFLVVTLVQPETNLEFIDRFLVTCELYNIPVTIVLNKVDLLTDDIVKEFCELYESINYKVIPSSTETKVGIEEIKSQMEGKISLFSGNSGVGKSTIIKTILPHLDIKIGEVSSVHNTGKHTTTFSQMFNIGNNSYLVDTPGIKSFGLIDVEQKELCRYFPEMFARSSECQFSNCTHTHEPKCAIKQYVENGEIPSSRYDSYVSMLENENEKYR